MEEKEQKIAEIVHDRYLKTLEFVVIFFTGLIAGTLFFKPDAGTITWLTPDTQLKLAFTLFIIGMIIFYLLTRAIAEIEIKMGWPEEKGDFVTDGISKVTGVSMGIYVFIIFLIVIYIPLFSIFGSASIFGINLTWPIFLISILLSALISYFSVVKLWIIKKKQR